ncbi:hypothetical protein QUA79_04970 [Microcoleus sp. F8-D1]
MLFVRNDRPWGPINPILSLWGQALSAGGGLEPDGVDNLEESWGQPMYIRVLKGGLAIE